MCVETVADGLFAAADIDAFAFGICDELRRVRVIRPMGVPADHPRPGVILRVPDLPVAGVNRVGLLDPVVRLELAKTVAGDHGKQNRAEPQARPRSILRCVADGTHPLLVPRSPYALPRGAGA